MRYVLSLFILVVLSTTLSAQNIGIGTANPDYTLDINGTLGINDFIYHNDDNDTWIGFPANDSFEIVVGGRKMVFADGTTNRFVINADQLGTEFIIVADGIEHLLHADPVNKTIGIGTSTPAYLVDINGDFRVIGDAIEHLFFIDSANDKIGVGTDAPSYLVDVSGDFRVIGDQIEHLFYVDAANEKIGIGTATPAYALDVEGEISSSNLRVAGNPLPFLETVRTGTELSLYSSSGNSSHTITIQFIPPFNTSPNVLGTIENISFDSDNIYINSLRSVSPSQAVFNVDIHASGNPTDSLKLTWMAWE